MIEADVVGAAESGGDRFPQKHVRGGGLLAHGPGCHSDRVRARIWIPRRQSQFRTWRKTRRGRMGSFASHTAAEFAHHVVMPTWKTYSRAGVGGRGCRRQRWSSST
jgi:hypothetical protein